MIPLLIIFIILTDSLATCEFEYHHFNISPNCVELSWNYRREGCYPVMLTLQALDRELATLLHPRLSLNSSSARFHFPIRHFMDEDLYFLVSGFTAGGQTCTSGSFTVFYNFRMLFENELNIEFRCPLSLSLRIPSRISGQLLYLLWPTTISSSGDYCLCPPHSFTFSSCVMNCETAYHFSIHSNSVHLQIGVPLQGGDILKLYFLYIEDSNVNGMRRSIYSFFKTIWISHQFSCNTRWGWTSSMSNLQTPILQYSVRNYTVTYNRSFESTARIDVTYRAGEVHYVSWRHNGSVVDVTTNSRISSARDGGLVINQVRPSDAGSYEVEISNSLGCDRASFMILVQYYNIEETTTITANDGSIEFQFLISSYPQARVLMWQKGIGEVISRHRYNVTSEERNLHYILRGSYVVSSIDECVASRGYISTMSTYTTFKILFPCPPGPPGIPQVQYHTSNNSVCFDAYSHTDHPVQYLINITSNSLDTVQITSSSLCLLLQPPATKLCIVVAAINSIGMSGPNQYAFPEEFACNDSVPTNSPRNISQPKVLPIRVHVEGASNCDQWIRSQTAEKLANFSGGVIDYIQDNCECAASAFSTNRSMFRCINNTNIVEFSAILMWSSALSERQVSVIIDQIEGSEVSIVIDGEHLRFREIPRIKNSTLNVSHTTIPTLYPMITRTWKTIVIPAAISGGIFIAFLTGLLIGIAAACKKCHSHKKSSNITAQPQSPIYEEIDDLSKFELSPPTNESDNAFVGCDMNEAYAVKGIDISMKPCSAYEC